MRWLAECDLLREVARALPHSDNHDDDLLPLRGLKDKAEAVKAIVDRVAPVVVECLAEKIRELPEELMQAADKDSANSKFVSDPTLFVAK